MGPNDEREPTNGANDELGNPRSTNRQTSSRAATEGNRMALIERLYAKKPVARRCKR
jgi:hypothetical protein